MRLRRGRGNEERQGFLDIGREERLQGFGHVREAEPAGVAGQVWLAACRRDLALLGKAPLVVILAVKMQGCAPLIGEKRI